MPYVAQYLTSVSSFMLRNTQHITWEARAVCVGALPDDMYEACLKSIRIMAKKSEVEHRLTKALTDRAHLRRVS